MAGGSPSWTKTQLSFVNTTNAKQGDLGSKVLPRAPTGVVWTAGSEVEAKWSLRANHGGGVSCARSFWSHLHSVITISFRLQYAYRLCPLGADLNEQCFRDHHLEFAGKTFLEFGNGTRIPIQGRFLSNGTTPAGSQWAMNPLPFAWGGQSPEFEPPCVGAHDLKNSTEWGLCAGRFPIDVTIVDVLKLPADLAAGQYVLGFRYDCEATAQVWASCADIEVAAAVPR